MSNRSYWEKETFQQDYDLIIVGAGITGLSTAHFFKQLHPGKTVLVLERGALPRGASTRNAGFACIGSISEHQADLERTSEKEVKERIRRRYKGLQLLKSLLGEDAINYDPCGGFELFTSEEQFANYSDHIATFNRWLIELVGEEEVYSAGNLNGYPVIKNRLEGSLHPGKMMRALIKTVEGKGVEIRWNAEVRQVQPAGFVLLDDGSTFTGEQVVIAANGFVCRLLPKAEVSPARGYVLVTTPVEGLAWKGTFHHDRGYIYFRNIGDRLLLGGARNIVSGEEDTDQFGVNPLIKSHLTEFAGDILNLPSGWDIENEWSGIMGFTSTKTPIVKQVEGRLYIAAGLSGMGIAIGAQVGKEAAALLNTEFK